MTQVWRDMQGVTSHQSVSDAKFLQMTFHLLYTYNFESQKLLCNCSYTVGGDTIAFKHFESPDEALDWIHETILDEGEKNLKALQNG